MLASDVWRLLAGSAGLRDISQPPLGQLDASAQPDAPKWRCGSVQRCIATFLRAAHRPTSSGRLPLARTRVASWFGEYPGLHIRLAGGAPPARSDVWQPASGSQRLAAKVAQPTRAATSYSKSP